MNYSRIVENGIDFVFKERLFAIYFIYAFALFLLLVPISNFQYYIPFIWYVAIVVTLLVGIFIEGILVRSFKYSNLNKTIAVVAKRYPTLLVTIVFISLLIFLVNFFSLLPYGTILTVVFWILISLMFLFVYQEILFGKDKIATVIQNCVGYFRKDFKDVLILAIVSWILSAIVLLIFAFPMIRYVSISLKTQFFVPMNTPVFWFNAFLLVLGITAAKLLSVGILTAGYFEVKKKTK